MKVDISSSVRLFDRAVIKVFVVLLLLFVDLQDLDLRSVAHESLKLAALLHLIKNQLKFVAFHQVLWQHQFLAHSH